MHQGSSPVGPGDWNQQRQKKHVHADCSPVSNRCSLVSLVRRKDPRKQPRAEENSCRLLQRPQVEKAQALQMTPTSSIKMAGCRSSEAKSKGQLSKVVRQSQQAAPGHGPVCQRGRRCHQELLCYTGRCMSIHYSDQLHTKGIWDMLQEKQAHAGPWSAAESHSRTEYPIHFFSQKRLVENPQHATTESSELETWQLAEYWMIQYLAKFDSRTMLASAWWCTAQIKGNHYGYWIFC